MKAVTIAGLFGVALLAVLVVSRVYNLGITGEFGAQFGPGAEFGSSSTFGPSAEFGSGSEFGFDAEFRSGPDSDPMKNLETRNRLYHAKTS